VFPRLKICQNAFAAGGPRWVSLQRSPDPLAGFGAPKRRGGEGMGVEGENREGKGRGKEGMGP